LSENEEEIPSETPPPKNTPPHKSVLFVDQALLHLELTPDVNQLEPTPQHTPQPPPEIQPEPEQQSQHSEPNFTVILHNLETTNEPFDQQSQEFQDLSRTLDIDHVEQSPPHNSELNTYMVNLENECIPSESGPKDSNNQVFIPQNLPSKILSQPPSSTQNDIEHLLKAVNKNIRRLGNSLPDMSIDSAHISDECKFMKEDLILMIDVVEQAYIKDLEFIKEATRLEAERLERERLEKERQEAEERERKRLEEERLEKERQEALRIEKARLEEEARIAAEKAKLAEFIQNALEVALKLTEDINHQKE
jgi:hypothetical protein